MATDHIIEMFKAELLQKLSRVGRVAFDEMLYDEAKIRFCLRRRRMEKGINQLVEEGKVRLEPCGKSYVRALDIVLTGPVKQ